MHHLPAVYGTSLALLTDLYQLTMAYGYWKHGFAEREAAFHLFFRKNPFAGGFTVACGLHQAMEFIEGFHYSEADITYLEGLRGNDDAPLFDAGFLRALGSLELTCDVDAVPEGTVVFPHEPLMRIRGPMLQCQLLETALLNGINFQSLIATKAARIARAAGDQPVLEFGLRRAQGIDGGLSASRAAYVGGCAATSNVLAGRLFGIPVRGTHAHSWVMFFDGERQAFEAYAEVMPNNCVFLVDTYDTLAGVKNAVAVGERLRAAGHSMVGIRLDSGDLAYLSIEARKLLDAAGFGDAAIVASNDLDEVLVDSLKRQGAQIGVWGIGTKLATAYDQPALGGVYKLAGVRGKDGRWQHRIKLSEQAIKTSNPGVQQVRRFMVDGKFIGDAIYDIDNPPKGRWTVVDQLDMTRQKTIPESTPWDDLLVPIFRGPKRIYSPPPLDESRARLRSQLASLHTGIKRFENPHAYPAGLVRELYDQKIELIRQARSL